MSFPGAKTFSLTTLGIATLSIITTLRMTLSITSSVFIISTLSITIIQHNLSTGNINNQHNN